MKLCHHGEEDRHAHPAAGRLPHGFRERHVTTYVVVPHMRQVRRLPGNLVNRAYCSEECTRAYAQLRELRKGIPPGQRLRRGGCTRECTVRYQILRKYGPEPVTVVTEV